MRHLLLKPLSKSRGKNIVSDFVYGCWCNGRRVGGMQMPPLNELLVATHCRAHGHDLEFIDAQFAPKRYAELHESGFAGFATAVVMSSTQSFKNDIRVLSEIKKANPEIRGILFGSHPTFMPNYCLNEEAVDYVVMREPEETVKELLAAVTDGETRIDTVAGIGYRSNNGVVLNEPRPFMDLDDLPSPDRSLLPGGVDYFNPVVKKLPFTTMQTSRGCPGKCIFCTAPSFYGRKVRYKSAEKVLEELREIKTRGYREVMFRDETFTAYKKRNLEIFESMIRENLNLSWIANGRVDLIDKETMRLMKRAGCHMIKFGVETGNDEILANYKKGTTCSQARQVFNQAREIGLDTHAHIIFGGPGETPATIRKTIAFVKEISPTTASFGILTPYPGSKLFERVAEMHPEIRDGSDSNMENLHIQGFFSKAVCNMTGEELSKWVTKAYRSFYMRPGYLVRRMSGIRSKDEFITLAVAGMNIFSFSLTGKK